MRTLTCGLLLAALLAAPAAAQTPAATGRTTTPTATGPNRPALPTNFGDTGFWFVPTAETLPQRNVSASVYRANFDRRQGISDVSELGVTGAFGITDRLELFGSWRLVRIDRDIRPVFVPSDPEFGGVSQEFPYVRRGWSKTLGGPAVVGVKWNLISQSRGDALSLAPRFAVKFPSGSSWASTNDIEGHIDLAASREFGQSIEASGMAGAILRGDSEQFSVSDGVKWGLGASFPSRSRLRALVEWHGEFVIDRNVELLEPPFVAEDGSIAPLFSPISDPTEFKVGGVFQASSGWFVHSGFNYSFGNGDRVVLGREFNHNAWGWDIRLGWHPGTKTYMPPPPPAPEVREIIREVPAPSQPPPPPPPANRPPSISGIEANPPVVEPGQNTNLAATATDPEGQPLTYRWSAPGGVFSNPNALSTIWTAPNVEGNVPLTLTVTDPGGLSSTSTITVPVVRRATIMFEDVHFDFDRFNLRPDALKILDDAVVKLQANPALNVTIEGHCDSIGTVEYNLALGERRSNSVRDYLQSRGIAANRLRTVSYGEERPIADNNTAEGRAMNRRAHLAVIIQ